MSSFDRAFQSHTAQQKSRDVQQQHAQNKQRMAAEAAAPIVQRLVSQFVRKLQTENVPPQQLKMGNVWSPAGYVITSSWGARVGFTLLGLTLVTPDEKIFTFSYYGEKSGFVAITPETILSDQVNWWGRLDISDNGQLLLDVGDESHNWQPFEQHITNSIAATAARLKEESVKGQPANGQVRFAAAVPSRLDNKLEAMRLEMEELRRQIEREKLTNNRRRQEKFNIKLYRLSLKYDRIAKRS